jgi:hypothetical protein
MSSESQNKKKRKTGKPNKNKEKEIKIIDKSLFQRLRKARKSKRNDTRRSVRVPAKAM